MTEIGGHYEEVYTTERKAVVLSRIASLFDTRAILKLFVRRLNGNIVYLKAVTIKSTDVSLQLELNSDTDRNMIALLMIQITQMFVVGVSFFAPSYVR